jgi:hypothetical protein
MIPQSSVGAEACFVVGKRNFTIFKENTMADIILEAVVSSNVAAIGFDAESGTMRVKFNNGLIYDAEGALQSDFDNFKTAKSKGIYFNKVLKQAFTWKRMEKKGA